MAAARLCNTVEAKAKLNELLHEVSQGREILIERRGKTVARIVPASRRVEKNDFVKWMERLRSFHRRTRRRHGVQSHTVTLLRELREEAS